MEQDNELNARDELNNWCKNVNIKMTAPLGFSVVADFAEYFAELKVREQKSNNEPEALPMRCYA